MSIHIIGGGLAGSEAAWQAASLGVHVACTKCGPCVPRPCTRLIGSAKLVCSNSFRGDKLDNAVGLLKEEMRRLGSLVMRAADDNRVPAGAALAVDRDRFSQAVTDAVMGIRSSRSRGKSHVHPGRSGDDPLILATGPLTSEALSADIARSWAPSTCISMTPISPIVLAESLDMDKVFRASRWGAASGQSGQAGLRGAATAGPTAGLRR